MEAAFFHVGIVVPDLEAAKAELSAALDVRWHATHESHYGDWVITVTHTEQPGPPWLELITGNSGSPWDAAGGARMDHIGYWSGDLPADRGKLECGGFTVEHDGTALGGRWIYLRSPATGLRVELLDVARKAHTYVPVDDSVVRAPAG